MFDPNGDYARSVPENLSAGRNLGAPVRATHENHYRLTYSIPASDLFEIHQSTGQLRTKVSLDHEDQARHTVAVTATDPGGLPASVTVTITVECQSVGEPPCAPGRSIVSSASDTSLRVTWPVARTPSGSTITGYEMQYR